MVKAFRLEVIDRPPRFKPGQFIHLALDEYDPSKHWPDSRPFTIASSPLSKKELSLVVANAGAFTSRMHRELEVGAEAWIKGPYGSFLIDCDPKHESVLIAGGTGISPFSCYLEYIQAADVPVERVQLHYAAKTRQLMSHQGLIEQAVSDHAGLVATRYLTAEEAEGYVSGRPDIRKICEGLTSPESATFYLCGPLQMVRSFTKILIEDYGVPAANVRFEEWS